MSFLGDVDNVLALHTTLEKYFVDMYQLGPASVEAVRRGDVGLGFDTAFVFTEVNADVFVYVPDAESSWGYRRAETNTDHVGKLVITKAIGYLSDDTENDYQVLTGDYKAKEGSIDERLVLMRAIRTSGSATADLQRYPGAKNQDVFLQMIDLDKGKYGENYKVSLFLHVSALKFNLMI